MENKIFVLIDWLKYDEPETVTWMTVEQYAEMLMQRKNKQIPVCVLRRVSPRYFRRWQRERLREEHSKAIQEKYNVGPNWRDNRWFVEAYQPTP